ncbi:MAG TPA: methyltransferase domain-containing protein [Planctomycetota bacterium]|nr:methyltransferase domain-containing protein [Planctomycetota bacterium]
MSRQRRRPRRTQEIAFLERYAPPLAGPYLEVGSKDYGRAPDLRARFASGCVYVGVDAEAGPGVDVVLDLTAKFDIVDSALAHRRFGTIFCFSTLEHCEQPFRMAENLTRLLRPDGHLVLSVPFSYAFHAYPSDYWRFTPEGVRKLFPKLDFDPNRGAAQMSTSEPFHPLDAEVGRIRFDFSVYWRRGQLLRALSAKLFRLLASLGIWRWLTGYRYVLAPTCIFMVGRQTAGQTTERTDADGQ